MHFLPQVGERSCTHKDTAEKQKTNDHDSFYTVILFLLLPLQLILNVYVCQIAWKHKLEGKKQRHYNISVMTFFFAKRHRYLMKGKYCNINYLGLNPKLHYYFRNGKKPAA